MDFRKFLSSKITEPIIPFLSRTGLTPDIITWTGLIIVIAAAVMVALNQLFAGGILVLVAGFCDMLDGALARYIQKTSKFGAVLDSTFDRISEAAVLFGLVYLYGQRSGERAIICLAFLVLLFSFLISYIKARAEGTGIACNVGFFTRTERVLVIAIGLLFKLVLIALVILAVFSFITVIQRLVHVYRHTRDT